MAISSIVHHPILDPQINNAQLRYQMVNQAFFSIQQRYASAMQTDHVDAQGRLVDGEGKCHGYRDAQGTTWVYAGAPNGRDTFVTFSPADGSNKAPSATVMHVGPEGQKRMTMAQAGNGFYQISEQANTPEGRIVESRHYGLTPSGAIENR